MSDIKVINELEFIGESLPKINFNFSDLDLRSQELESFKSQYMSLSSFYVRKDNSLIEYQNIQETLNGGSGNFNKSSILASDPSINVNKLIYPIPIYIRFKNNAENSNPNLRFKVKYKSSSTEIQLLNFKINSAFGSSGTSSFNNLYNFQDDGYFDWTVSYDNGSDCEVTINYIIKKYT
jgi:hypothetical protein